MIDIENLPGLYDNIQTTTPIAYAGFNTNIKLSIPKKEIICTVSEKRAI